MLPLFFLIIFCVIPLHGIEIEITGGVGDISFDTGSKEFLGSDIDPQPFAPHFYPLIKAVVSGESGFIYYRGGFEREPILRNRIFANVGINLNFFNIDVGPFVGIFNTQQQMFNPGLSIALGLQVPGIIFMNLHASSSLGGALKTIGENYQSDGAITAGFYVPYVICSFNLETRSFSHNRESNLLTEDSLTKYFFRADVFTKNVPFTVRIDMGYGMLKRIYYSQSILEGPPPELVSDALIDEFKFVYVGAGVTFNINSTVSILFSGEVPVYYWSVPKMKNLEKGVLFNATAGVVLTF